MEGFREVISWRLPTRVLSLKEMMRGVFYGVQTLIQLLPVKAGVLADIPLVTIHDEPSFCIGEYTWMW